MELGAASLADLVQAALLKAWEKAETFRGETEGEFVAWFLMIVRHLAIDEVRRRRREPLLLDGKLLDDFASPLRDEEQRGIDEPQQREAVERALGKLGAVERAVVELVFRYGYAQTEAAALLDMELPAFRMAQLRAIRKLRRAVDKT